METTKVGLKREGKRQQQAAGFIIQNLKRGAALLGKASSSTPPPSWRLEASSHHHGTVKTPVREFLHFPTSKVSARNLCACLWRILPHQEAPLAAVTNVYTTPCRRRRRDKSFEQPASASNLKKQVAASLAQHHRSVEQNCHAIQPLSSSNHGNLAETARCNCEVTPTSSLDVKGRIRESSCCNFKTSRELLKVLNRIQSIKEQHASNISVVNDLKVELDLSRAQIKELKREKQMNIWQMKSLTKQTAEKKFVRRNNANDRLKIAVQSVEEELEGETRSRRHPESLHCRLALELSEVKSLFYGSLRALERERKARILLENLCDEFAIGIKDYKQEVRSLKHKSEKSDDVGVDNLDRSLVDISEAWLDERMQMKEAKAGDDLVEINSVVDKLGFDIETFLRAKGSVNLRKYGNSYPEELVREVYPCQYYSLDSFPLKDQSIGAPVNVHDDDNAKNFGSASGEGYGNIRSIDQEKKGGQISTRKQVQTKQIKSSLSHDENQRRFVERNSSDRTSLINETEVSTVWEEPAQVAQESDGPLIRRLNSSDRKSFLPTGGENICRGAHCVHSVVRSNVSPVKRQRKLQFSKVMGQSQEGTLMAKLLEARSDVRKSGSEASTSCLG